VHLDRLTVNLEPLDVFKQSRSVPVPIARTTVIPEMICPVTKNLGEYSLEVPNVFGMDSIKLRYSLLWR
jgi:hypothetical protein